MTELAARSIFDTAFRGDSVQRVGVVEGALSSPQQFAALAALFPNVQFEMVGSSWPDRSCDGLSVLIAAVDGSLHGAIEGLARRLRVVPRRLPVAVLLGAADVSTTRMLMREGAADVIPAPASEATLAVTLDKLLASAQRSADERPAGGQIVAVLKAGGGVGATALAVQAAAMAARRATSVCFVDLDLQFGSASVYLDLADAATVTDCMAAGSGLREIDFSALLGRHSSSLRLLAAPRQVTPLEALSPSNIDTLFDALKRSFDLVVVDLPSVWTAWTNRALQLADRTMIVTHLTVPHLHMLDRQITTLRTQGLEDRRQTLVCNALSPEQAAVLSLKSAERALGRQFDVIVPEDRKLMYAAINQGVEISAVRRGSKIEKAITQLADVLAPQVHAEPAKSRWGR